MTMTGKIDLQDIVVSGVDTHARAASLRQWIARRKTLTSSRIPILRGV